MRKRPNLEPRMEACAMLMENTPQLMRGAWLSAYPECDSLQLELGCGKGRFTADTAEADNKVLLVAMEKVPDAMIIAMERVKDRNIKNVRFIDGDAAKLTEMFAPDEVSRIYINFCDPWPKSRDAKFRLTSPGFLRLYASVLPIGGEIHFKTDNLPLFNWSLEQLSNEGWKLSEMTNDLHAVKPTGIMTDYEAKFYMQGYKINRVVATKTEATASTAAGAVARMHNAALTDAKGYEESMRAHKAKENNA